MTTSKTGGRDGVGVVVRVGEKGVDVSVVVSDGCVAVSSEEGLTVGELCGAHAVQRTRTERKTTDFLSVLMRRDTS
jgi:hypothetical protein